jgi:hypothetical protein
MITLLQAVAASQPRPLPHCCSVAALQVSPVTLSDSVRQHKLVYSLKQYHELMATLDGKCQHYRAPA